MASAAAVVVFPTPPDPAQTTILLSPMRSAMEVR
jgi:hypothetical protein